MGTCAMSLMSLPRLASIAAAIVLPATLLHAAVPPPAEVPGQASLTGQLLIAAPTMGDPRFQHTVILMVRHDRNGALGIVINRPLGDRRSARRTRQSQDKCASSPAVRCSPRSASWCTAPNTIAPTPSTSTAASR